MDMTCRACLKTNLKLYNIYEQTQNQKPILSILLEFVTIKIEINDGLPQNICLICLEKLKKLHDFKTMLIESDRRLHLSDQCDMIRNDKLEVLDVENIDEDSIKLEELNSITSSNDHLELDIHSENDFIDDSVSVIMKKEKLSDIITNNFKNIYQIDSGTMITKESNFLNPQDSCDAVIDSGNNTCDLTTSSTQDEENLSEERAEPEFQFLNILDVAKPKSGVSKKEQDQKMLLCQFCDKSFSFRYYLDIHIHQHTGNTPYQCDFCGKRYAKRSLLNTHKQGHSDDRRYTCEVCGKNFKRRGAVQSHMVTHSDVRQHKCDICGKGYKLPGPLKLHRQRHNKEKPCTCEVCGKSFRLKGDLNGHMVVHNTEKNFSCSTCGKCFSNKFYLKTHCKRHLNVRPYSCDKCDRSFNSNIILKSHLLIHSGEKPHACSICGKTFRQAACIPRHMRIHTGETPYSCEKCSLKFKYKHHLLNHIKKHV